MNKLVSYLGVICIVSIILTSCNDSRKSENKMNGTDSTQNNSKNEQALKLANDQFYSALNAMFAGKMEPMNAIWSHSNEVSDMDPFGGRIIGWDSVGAEFKKEAGMKLGGKVDCKDLIVHAGSDMGYTFCREVGENMSAEGKPVMVSFRATNVFRMEKGEWKLVHHHTDISQQLKEATTK